MTSRRASCRRRALPAELGGGGGGAGSSVPGMSASSIAVERWAAEKKLQKKVEGLREKLTHKARELSVCEGELARVRAALDAAQKREADMREGMVAAQEAAQRHAKDREGYVEGALTEMRTREELSASLYHAEQELAKAQAELRARAAAAAAAAAARRPTCATRRRAARRWSSRAARRSCATPSSSATSASSSSRSRSSPTS